MSDPEVIGDRQRYAEAGRLFNQLSHRREARARSGGMRSPTPRAREEMLAEGGDDPELRAEMETARERMEELEEEIRLAMVERDPNDDKNVIVEIRAGAGGDEAGLWAGDLYRMLTRYAERRGFKTETLAAARRLLHVRDQGRRRLLGVQVRGRHAPRAARAGDGVAGAHPHLDRDGRRAAGGRGRRRRGQPDRPARSTSTARRARAGSRSTRPTPPCGSRTSRPGIVVSMQDEKSQLQNREKAMKVLRARLYEAKLAEQQAELAAERRAQVGTGERAEKIRTYNFPERRVTDHRVEADVHNLEEVLGGALDEQTAALQDAEKRARLEAAT